MRDIEKGGKSVLGGFDFPRKRYWKPTAAWERASQRNLARAPRRHTGEESLNIKNAVWDWLDEQDANARPTQEALAHSLGVSKQYVNRLVHTLPPRIALPPLRRASVPEQPVPVGIDGHGWNCECGGCRAQRAINAALREVRENKI